MHKDFKRFGMEGQFKDDSKIPSLREQYEAIVLTDMRDIGYVPILGLGPFWSTLYNAVKDWYEFKLSIHGVHIGKERAWKVEGMTTEGEFLLRPTRQNKSNTSSESAT